MRVPGVGAKSLESTTHLQPIDNTDSLSSAMKSAHVSCVFVPRLYAEMQTRRPGRLTCNSTNISLLMKAGVPLTDHGAS